MAASLIRFESTCFWEFLKVAVAFFTNQQCYFFFKIKCFHVKIHPKKHVRILTSMMEENSIIGGREEKFLRCLFVFFSIFIVYQWL